MYYVYVLRNAEGRLYIGQTSDLATRVEQHLSGLAGWTKNRGPWKLVHSEEFPDQSQAMRRERELKSGRANQALRSRFGPPR